MVVKKYRYDKMKKNKKEKKMQKKNNGITIIALAVTIIVMLILAGVTISILVGNSGISKRAEEAKKASEIAQIEESMNLAYAEKFMDKSMDGEQPTLDDVKDLLEEQRIYSKRNNF